MKRCAAISAPNTFAAYPRRCSEDRRWRVTAGRGPSERVPRPFHREAGRVIPMTTHPDWCIAFYCTANEKLTGAHRGRITVMQDGKVATNLYASAGKPDVVYVELCGDVLLPYPQAYELGE